MTDENPTHDRPQPDSTDTKPESGKTQLSDEKNDGTHQSDHSTGVEPEDDSTTTVFDGVSPAITANEAAHSASSSTQPTGEQRSSEMGPPDSKSIAETEDDIPDDANRGTLEPPQRNDPTEQGALSIPNYAQDLLDFEFVLEAYDDYLPGGVSGEGMIVVDNKEYVGLAEVTPRSWSIHTGEKKTEIIDAYKSAFLATLEFPIQIVSYPTKFDISDHVERLNEVISGGRTRSTDSQLVNLGRHLYPNWLERFILRNDMKQRRFYIVVPISARQINQFQATESGLLQSAADRFPPLEPVASFFGEETENDVSRQQCLRELDSRLNMVASGLQRLDVNVERLSDRDEVMSVLYHYYNNEQPLNDVFPTGPYSIENEDAPITNPLNKE